MFGDEVFNENDLMPIRCGYCGRFHGFECILNGIAFIRCHNCKQWIVLVKGEVEMGLTGEEIYDMLNRKAKRP